MVPPVLCISIMYKTLRCRRRLSHHLQCLWSAHETFMYMSMARETRNLRKEMKRGQRGVLSASRSFLAAIRRPRCLTAPVEAEELQVPSGSAQHWGAALNATSSTKQPAAVLMHERFGRHHAPDSLAWCNCNKTFLDVETIKQRKKVSHFEMACPRIWVLVDTEQTTR